MVADTQFINEFVNHIEQRFNPKTGSLLFPDCLAQIEQTKVKFESVTNNLGRTLMLTRQDDRIGFKLLIAVGKNDKASEALSYTIDQVKEICHFSDKQIFYVSVAQMNQLAPLFSCTKDTVRKSQCKELSQELAKKGKFMLEESLFNN